MLDVFLFALAEGALRGAVLGAAALEGGIGLAGGIAWLHMGGGARVRKGLLCREMREGFSERGDSLCACSRRLLCRGACCLSVAAGGRRVGFG